MNKFHLLLLLLVNLFNAISNNDQISLRIKRAMGHEDKTGNFTPLVVSVISEDIDKKVKGVDLVSVVDLSGSMYGDKLDLVKESLKYLVNLMDDRDNFALVTFSEDSEIKQNFIKMAPENKTEILKNIDDLYATGSTNIYSGLKDGLSLLNHNYTSGQQIASMILLSDGEDNEYGEQVINKFKELLINENKDDYTFSLHTLGFGDDHDADLMTQIANIKDGGYFAIEKLADVKDAYLEIYGALSTVNEVNLDLEIFSKFVINKTFGFEDMYKANFDGDKKFNTILLQIVYGKKYEFVLLVDVPENTTTGTEILSASISKLGITAKYFWDKSADSYDSYAYEEYIRCICVICFKDGYNKGTNGGKAAINNGLTWIQTNYKGNFNWEREFINILNDLKTFDSFGRANILSKIRELNTNKIGIHYKNENSYQRLIIDNSHGINMDNYPIKRVTGEEIINTFENINYYYFYLKEGEGQINNITFSGSRSSFVICTIDINTTINIKSSSQYMEFRYYNETKERIQSIVDFNKPGKFLFKKDFPFEFYSRVDGRSDVTFNIEFLKLDSNESSNQTKNLIEIKAYILDDNAINSLKNNNEDLPTKLFISDGNYDDILKEGKIVVNKDKIFKLLNPSAYNNYLYIVVYKNPTSNIIYNNVEGQFLFSSMDSSIIPENYTIFSDYEPKQKIPHLYIIKMVQNKDILIEFGTTGNELNCKILKYQLDLTGVDKYIDYKNFSIKREKKDKKTYINVIQSNKNDISIENIYLSIFSDNKDHISSDDTSKLSYTIKYSVKEKSNSNSNDNNSKDYTMLIIIISSVAGVVLIILIILLIVIVRTKSSFDKLKNEVNKISFHKGNTGHDDEEDLLQ